MGSRIRRAVLALLIPCSFPGAAQATSPGIGSGRAVAFPAAGHSYLLTAPPGWIFDEKGELPGMPRRVFRPAGTSLNPPPVATASYFAAAAGMEAFVEAELAHFRAANPRAVVQAHPDLKTRWGMRIAIHSFREDRHGHSGWIGDISAPQGVIQIVMRVPSGDGQALEGAFAALAKSCVWLKADLIPAR